MPPVQQLNIHQTTAAAVTEAWRAAELAHRVAPGSPEAYRATQAYYETRHLAAQANASRNAQATRQAAQTAQASSSYVNNVAAGRAPNTYSPYDSNGNAYSYYNSSYDTGKIPSPDSPRVKDVDPGNVEYCEKQESKAEGLEKLLVWHIDSKAELVGYSVLTVSLDLVAYGMAVNGIIVGLAATPETLGGSIVVSTVSM